jgi:hypothetical protein
MLLEMPTSAFGEAIIKILKTHNLFMSYLNYTYFRALDKRGQDPQEFLLFE